MKRFLFEMGITQDIAAKQTTLKSAELRAKNPATDARDATEAQERVERLQREIAQLEASAKVNAECIKQLRQLATSLGASARKTAARTKAEERIREAMLWLQHDLDHE